MAAAQSWADYWDSLKAAQDGTGEALDPPNVQQQNIGGANPFMNDPTASNPPGSEIATTHYNPVYFPTEQTANDVAGMMGGTVGQGSMLQQGGGGFTQNQPNYTVTLPNGRVINPGFTAQYEQQYADNPQMLQRMIQSEATGGEAPEARAPQTTSFAPFSYDPQTPNAADKAVISATNGYLPNGTQLGSYNTGAMQQRSGTPQGTPQGQQLGGSAVGSSNPGGVSYNTGVDNSVGAQAKPKDFAPPPQMYSASSANPSVNVSGGEPSGLTSGILPGGYGVSVPGPMPNGVGAIGGTPLTFQYKSGTTPGDILANDRAYAYGQGGQLISNYGQSLADQQQRARQLAGVGDELYAFLQQNPGYTPEQAQAILNQGGLDALNWTPEMAQSNFLTGGEQGDILGNPYDPLHTYNDQVENLRQDARNYQGSLTGIYNTGATDINSAVGGMSQRLDNAIDPAALGLSSEYSNSYNFGPEDAQAIIEDAGRTVGQGTAAVTDQLQREANAAGTNAPLAMSAALDRQRQTGAVASADAMTKARIQAKQLELQTEQQRENTRLATQQDIASRRAQAAQIAGGADVAAQEYLTSGRANAGLQTGAAALNESNQIANTQTQLTSQGEAAAAQRAQALAQNRQQVNSANQAAQFQRGSYNDQAASQRQTQLAGAARADQTQARQDVRNEEQTGYNEGNSMMAGQLQAFGGVTGAGQASQANAIRAAQLPSTLDKVIGGVAGAAGGLGLARGGVVTKPTVAKLGESGPEIVIKLRNVGGGLNYRRRNEEAYA